MLKATLFQCFIYQCTHAIVKIYIKEVVQDRIESSLPFLKAADNAAENMCVSLQIFLLYSYEIKIKLR